MSLDLYIESKTPITHRSTGVFIREHGVTRALETKKEVLEHFPHANPDEIVENVYEDNIYFHINITHNLAKMAKECQPVTYCSNGLHHPMQYSLYQLLWHPEQIGTINPSEEYEDNVIQCYKRLLEEPDFFKKYNPENGWGSYDQLLEGTRNFMLALENIKDAFEDYVIVASN